VFVPSGDPRRRSIVASYLGLKGQIRSTLEEVGKNFKITRERVRQLCSPSHLTKSSPLPAAPLLDSLIERVRARSPAPVTTIEHQLVSEGLLDNKTRLENVLDAAMILRRTRKVVIDKSVGVLADVRMTKHLCKILAHVAKSAAKFGVLTIN